MKEQSRHRPSQATDTLATERVLMAAQAARLGPLERSLRINRDDDAGWKANGILIFFVAPWPFIALTFLMPEPRWGKLFTLAVGVAVLLLGLLMFALAVSIWRSGIALAHFFASGLVLERTRGVILTLPYDRIRVDYLTWRDTTNDSERIRTQLWIAEAQNRVAVLDAGNEAERRELSWMAARLGSAGSPREIGAPEEVPVAW